MHKDVWRPGTRREAHTTISCPHCGYAVTASGKGAVSVAVERMLTHDCQK